MNSKQFDEHQGAECAIHNTVRYARSFGTAAQRQKQCKVFALRSRKLVMSGYFQFLNILTVDQYYKHFLNIT